MEKIPVENKSTRPMYVGGTLIPPGETRHFDERDVPAHLRPEPPAPPADAVVVTTDPIAVLLGKDTAEIVALLPGLSAETLDALGRMEHAKGEATRGDLMDALQAAYLERMRADDEAADAAREKAQAEAKAKDEAEAAAAAQAKADTQAKAEQDAEAARATLHLQMKELCAKPQKEVIAAVPNLTDEHLGYLEVLEKEREPKPRPKVLEAISGSMLERAGKGSGE